LIPCLTKKLFGIDCPGCGMQRSFFALIKGDLISSFVYFPSLPIYLLLIVLFICSLLFKINISYKLYGAVALVGIITQLSYYGLRMAGVIEVGCYFN